MKYVFKALLFCLFAGAVPGFYALNGCASVAGHGASDVAKLEAAENQFCADIQALGKVDPRVSVEVALCNKIAILRTLKKAPDLEQAAGAGGK